MSGGAESGFRCGFAAIIGAPNAGKSTLLNRFLGVKVAAVSKKPQTTRTRILGVWTGPAAQIVFLDSPGIHRPQSALHQAMVRTALAVLDEAEAVLWVKDAAAPRARDEALIHRHLKGLTKPVIVALNKIDLIKPPELLPLMDGLASSGDFAALVPISALNGDGLEGLTRELVERLPEGGPLFDEDTLTDQPERVLAAEMVREKVFRLTGQEIPYGVAVLVTDFEDRPEKEMVYIRAVIHVEKESHKGILIGAKGARLKKIGQAARADIERLLGIKVFLELFVRVEKNWTKSQALIRRMGYES